MSIDETELIQFELGSKRDDLFDVIVPSDVRRMLAEIRRLQSDKTDQPDQCAALLQRIKDHYPQVDNGTCAVCRIGYREYIKGKPGPCQNGSCLSHAIDEAITSTVRESGFEHYVEALTPSTDTKAHYNGEFQFPQTRRDENGYEYSVPVTVPWTTVKEIMAAIKKRAEYNASARVEGAKHAN